jgi:nitrite reductase (NADH) small subunit
VTFPAGGAGNCVETGSGAYVYAQTRHGEFVMPATCPHRGGPLHLAEFAGDSPRLVCPWHGHSSYVARWLHQGIPAVRRGNTVTAVLPADAGAGYRRTHRPLSADLARAC